MEYIPQTNKPESDISAQKCCLKAVCAQILSKRAIKNNV